MKILVACELPDFAVQELRSLATELSLQPRLTPELLPAHLRDTAVLIVSDLPVSAEAIAAAPSLQMIVRAGADVSNISLEEASAQGIFVVNTPLRDAAAVAEYVLAAILALDRRLPDSATSLRDGAARRHTPPAAAGLAGRTLGLLGYDRVGEEIARRALAFDMRVLAWSPSLEAVGPTPPGVEFCDWPRDLAHRSNFVALYAPPGAPEDLRIDGEFIAGLPEAACIVIVGSAAAFDDEALADAVRRRRLSVAIDLWPAEGSTDQVRFRSPLLELPGVIGTLRLAADTRQARDAVAEAVVQRVRSFAVQGLVQDCVNLLERSPATWQLVLRLRDAVGVMAGIMDAIRSDGINAEEITSRVFTGARAAWCTIALDERPSADAIETIRRLPGVLHLEIRAVV